MSSPITLSSFTKLLTIPDTPPFDCLHLMPLHYNTRLGGYIGARSLLDSAQNKHHRHRLVINI